MTNLLCKIDGKPAIIVGYGPGPKGEPKAIVILNGELRAVKLKHIELENIPEEYQKAPKLRSVPK